MQTITCLRLNSQTFEIFAPKLLEKAINRSVPKQEAKNTFLQKKLQHAVLSRNRVQSPRIRDKFASIQEETPRICDGFASILV